RLWRLVSDRFAKIEPLKGKTPDVNKISASGKDLLTKVHKTIKKVTDDLEKFQFNTAIAAVMELLNDTSRFDPAGDEDVKVVRESVEAMVRLLYPIAPHVSEELWSELGYEGLLVDEPWLEWNKGLVAGAAITVVVQVNGKVRAQLSMDADVSDEDMKEAAFADEKVRGYLAGKEPRKVFVVPKKIVNIVV
ncbi:MAG: class I tRNA ligase family protein, partial [Thermodesulfobacteriota bacterium]